MEKEGQMSVGHFKVMCINTTKSFIGKRKLIYKTEKNEVPEDHFVT